MAGLIGGYLTAKFKRSTEAETLQMQTASALLERVKSLEEKLEQAQAAEVSAAVLAEKLETKMRRIGYLERELAEAQDELRRLRGEPCNPGS